MTSTDNSVSYCTRRYVPADCSLRMHGTLHGVGGGLWELVAGVTQRRHVSSTMIEATHTLSARDRAFSVAARRVSNRTLQNSRSTRYVGRAPSRCVAVLELCTCERYSYVR